MLTKIRSEKWQYARIHKETLLGSKDAASEDDKMGLIAICLWEYCLKNTEFLNLFQSMYQNCGRGSEIAILDWKSLSLKDVKAQNSVNFKTLSQYVERLKTEG